VFAGEIGAELECMLGQWISVEDASCLVRKKLRIYALRVNCRQGSAKLMLTESVEPLRLVE